jgi:hypothetical protein
MSSRRAILITNEKGIGLGAAVREAMSLLCHDSDFGIGNSQENFYHSIWYGFSGVYGTEPGNLSTVYPVK